MEAALTPKSKFRVVLLWTGRILAGLIGIAVLIALAGAAFEAIAAAGDAERYPMPGRLVDVGGHRLHIRCIGSGSPTVVFDSGLGGSSLDWVLVQPAVAKTTRACAYDRAGFGWSDPGPAPRTARRIAAELHTLLVKAGIAGPYVLVGHSLGGKNVRMFAAAYPGDVAGMVLVDARHEYMDFHASAADAKALTDSLYAQAPQYRLARVLGVARLFGPQLLGAPTLPRETARQIVVFATRQSTIDATIADGIMRSANDIDLRNAPSLGEMPLVLVVSGENMKALADWREAQRRQAALSRDSRLVVAEGARHYVQWDRPALVIDAIGEVVAKARQRAGR